jgi:SAM-dependent methyltransferase
MDLLLDATFKAEQRHFWFQGFRRFVTPLLDRAAGGRTDLALLDCGCGTGANLALLARYGRAFGIDLTMRGLEYGRAAGIPRLARASVTHLPFPDAAFDVATSFDVLYSLTDEQEALALGEMRRVLKPGGAVVINVAAMPVLRGDHSVASHELRRYTRARLSAPLREAGFEVLRLTYTNATLFPLVLGVRLSQRVLGLAAHAEEASHDLTVPAWPVNRTLASLLAAEAAAARHVDLPFGSSLLCLGRKR